MPRSQSLTRTNKPRPNNKENQQAWHAFVPRPQSLTRTNKFANWHDEPRAVVRAIDWRPLLGPFLGPASASGGGAGPKIGSSGCLIGPIQSHHQRSGSRGYPIGAAIPSTMEDGSSLWRRLSPSLWRERATPMWHQDQAGRIGEAGARPGDHVRIVAVDATPRSSPLASTRVR